MKNITNLEDLLIQHLENIHACEMQILNFMPDVIKRVHHSSVKNALNHHLNLTQEQIKRLEQAIDIINGKRSDVAGKITLNEAAKSKGAQGLIEEARELLQADLALEVTDATIIACVQKLEHYEITSYGTAIAYASHLKLHKIENLLHETLNEEYDADDLLTSLAKAAINKEAIPEGLVQEEPPAENYTSANEDNDDEQKVSISERTINSPGGRAGTSHRRYPSGESRGH